MICISAPNRPYLNTNYLKIYLFARVLFEVYFVKDAPNSLQILFFSAMYSVVCYFNFVVCYWLSLYCLHTTKTTGQCGTHVERKKKMEKCQIMKCKQLLKHWLFVRVLFFCIQKYSHISSRLFNVF